MSDQIDHAKCYSYEWIDCDYDRFHRFPLDNMIHQIAQEKDEQDNADTLTTAQKLQMSNAGSLSELQKKEQSRILSAKIVLMSNVKLKAKQKSKIYQ